MNPLRPTLGCCGVRPKAPKGSPLLTAGPPGSGGANFDAELALYEAQDAQLEPLWSGGGLLEHRRRLRQASAEKPSANTPAPLDADEEEEGSRGAPNGHVSGVAKPGVGQSAGAAARGALGSGGGQQSSSFFAPSAAAAGKEHVAVIQGASGGIGLELVTQLLERRDLRARSGGRVVATCRHPEACPRLQALQGQYPDRLFIVSLDVTDDRSIEEAADLVKARYRGGIHLLINASGVLHLPGQLHPEPGLAAVTAAALTTTYAVNAMGPLLVLRAFAPLLTHAAKVNSCPGVPVVAASLSARVSSLKENRLGGWYAYRASKTALNMLMRTAAVEMAKEQAGVLVVLLHPGTVDTALSRPFNRNVPEKMLFSPQASVTCLFDVISRLKQEDNGRLLGWDGSAIDW